MIKYNRDAANRNVSVFLDQRIYKFINFVLL